MPKLKRVALVQIYTFHSGSVPTALLSLASYIKQYGYEPVIIDLSTHFGDAKGYSSDFFKKAAEKILSYDPQVLGITVTNSNLPCALLIAQECKRAASQLPMILGGPEASFEEVELLKTFKQVDIVVRGEGEITLVELLKALEEGNSLSNILGITYREGERVIRNPDRSFIKDLDDLPILDFDLIPHLEKYNKINIEAGRGCPFSCTFCSTCKMWKRGFRIKSPARLVQEIKNAYQKAGHTTVRVIHDNFLASKNVAEEFLDLMACEKVAWECDSRPDKFDEILIKKLKQAGCQRIYFGIETGSLEMQKKIKKNFPLQRAPHILKKFFENGIQVELGFIIGFPDETELQINQTLLMALRLKSKFTNSLLHIEITPFIFFKGSELYAEAKNKFGQAESVKFCVFDQSPLVTDLPAERSLIMEHPRIFPQFYHVKDSGFSPRILRKIYCFFRVVIEFFPLTALLLLEGFSLAPLELCQKIIPFYDEEEVDGDNEAKSFLNYFANFIAFVIDKTMTTPGKKSDKLMKVFVEELAHSCFNSWKISDYLTIISCEDKYLLAQGILGKIVQVRKKVFDSINKYLNLKAPSEIERIKKRLMEYLVIVPEMLKEHELIEILVGNRAANNKECLKCRHVFFCIKRGTSRTEKGKGRTLCEEKFEKFLQGNLHNIKRTAVTIQ